MTSLTKLKCNDKKNIKQVLRSFNFFCQLTTLPKKYVAQSDQG